MESTRIKKWSGDVIMKKHAYLIMAHKNINQLQLLINALDFKDNDIYLMVDRKSKMDINTLKTTFSPLLFTNRIDVHWGSDSQIKAEMCLFKKAYNSNCNYDYYHLISGQDYPLASQEEIHKFFDNNPNHEFLTFSDMATQQELSIRLHNFLFSNSFRTDNIFIKIIHKLQRNLYKGLFKLKKNNDKIYFGANWCSIDNDFVKYLVDNEQYIERRFFKGFLADEVYKHQLIMENKHFRDKVYKLDGVHDLPEEFQGNLRYINWWDGSPYTWTKNDIYTLIKARKQGHLFSRKFDNDIDSEIIQMINNELIKRK